MAIALMVLGFIWWWPVGLVVLFLLLARRRFGGWHAAYAGDGAPQEWRGTDRWERKMSCAQAKMDRLRSRMERFSQGGGGWSSRASSGNSAFDEYRTETLKRLEDEQREFKDFFSRLRFAKDRAEFDQFMTERRQRSSEPTTPPTEHHN